MFAQPAVLAITQDDINSILGGTAYYDAGSTDCSGASLTGDNAQTVFSYFLSKGYSKEQAAGIIGNMTQESGVDPLKWQGDRKDHDTPPNPDDPNEGWGLVQWTPASKILDYASSVSKTPGDIVTQLDFLAAQLDGSAPNNPDQAAGDALKAVTTTGPDGAVQAADVFEDQFEHPDTKNLSYQKSRADREASAKATLAKYGSVAASSPSSSCSCASTGATQPSAATGQTTVFLDPGHAGANTEEIDPVSGLKTIESGGAPGEMQNMWDVAQTIKSKLENDGYKVVLSKNNEADTAGFITKAGRANSSGAAIGVSLHYTPGNFGSPMSDAGVTPQEVGEYRVNKDGSGQKVTFSDTLIAQESQEYAQDMVDARNATGDKTQIAQIQFDQTYVEASGNIPVIELLSKVPWVYNEVGDSGFNATKYATGITNGIEKAVPATGAPSGGGQGCPGAVAGNAVATAVNYAWPDYKGDPFCDETSAYKKATDQALNAGQYTGADCGTNSSLHGIDCGAFVTRVMIDSGADPGYNNGGSLSNGAGNTITQQAYLDDQVKAGKYQNLGSQTSTSNLLAGDIAINTTHTFIYIGQQTGFNGNIASASESTRSPMAGSGSAIFSNSAGSFTWYRLVE